MKFMKHNIGTLICSVLAFPLLCYAAEIHITNNSNSFGTLKSNIGLCSSAISSDGLVKPKSSVTLSHAVLFAYCPFGCNVDLYASKDCSGKSLATLKINLKKEITHIDDHHVDGFSVVGDRHAIVVDGGPAEFMDWLMSS